jgi:membrane protease YdiL (CAAX protease family)
LFWPDAQDSVALQQATIFVNDGRLRPLWRVCLFAAVVICLTVVLWSIYDIAAGGLQHEPSLMNEAISGEIAGAIAVVITAFGMRRFVDRRSTESLGLSFKGPWLRFLVVGACFGAGMQGLVFTIEALGGGIRTLGFGSLLSDVRLLAFALGVFAAGGVLEELCFRGYLLQNLWESLGLIPSIVITSVLFACLHLGNPSALASPVPTLAGLLFFAVWACCSLLWTRSLWLALGAHVAWNLFEGPVFGFPISGLLVPAKTVVIQEAIGPDWLTGGAFGPEAGASALVAMTIGLALLYVLYRRGFFRSAPDVREFYAR